MKSLYWLRNDLRVADNPALTAALKSGETVALYVLDDSATPTTPRAPGGACRWWLHHALASLTAELGALGVPLVLRRGDSATQVESMARAWQATSVHWGRCYDAPAVHRDTALKEKLTQSSMKVESHNTGLLFEPWAVKNQTGNPYRVYTPFSKACFALPAPRPPLPVPKKQAPPQTIPASDTLESWGLLPTAPNWAKGFNVWQPNSAAALQRLHEFCDGIIENYANGRDRPDRDNTSRLSPYLRFGNLSPHQAWHAAMALPPSANTEKFLKELLWREFAYSLLFHNPTMPSEPLDAAFAAFPWQPNDAALHAWQRGQTGYPIVDAGMRQLWQTGWMHNRVRMVCASFLIKHLLQPWQAGEQWFWDTLVDADIASNTASWQWVAGCGADAAPFFRIFNPIIQGEKFDPNGDYVRAWVPEVGHLPNTLIHKPWQAPKPPAHYPAPMVDHTAARDRALAALKCIKGEQE